MIYDVLLNHVFDQTAAMFRLLLQNEIDNYCDKVILFCKMIQPPNLCDIL